MTPLLVKFPTVSMMKMELLGHNAKIDVDQEDTLLSVKEKIFNFFWDKLWHLSPMGRHGKPEDVLLKDRDFTEITTMEELQELMARCEAFQVVFKGKHPMLRPSF
jgi:hypothetical protein